MDVCKGCGTVYVRRRRPSSAVADDWSANLYGDHFFTAAKPYMKARHLFVAESLHQAKALTSVCDVGAGEGFFLELAKTQGATTFGIEPSTANCARMTRLHIPNYCGTAETFTGMDRFDVVTLLWVLENCADIRGVVQSAKRLLAPGGRLVVATGSRIMVPFKKALSDYIDRVTPADTNPYRLSANTLQALFAHNGLRTTWINHYRDSDILMAVAEVGSQEPPATIGAW